MIFLPSSLALLQQCYTATTVLYNKITALFLTPTASFHLTTTLWECLIHLPDILNLNSNHIQWHCSLIQYQLKTHKVKRDLRLNTTNQGTLTLGIISTWKYFLKLSGALAGRQPPPPSAEFPPLSQQLIQP